MPKRIVHGEGIWRSDKLAKVEPEWVRADYANWLPLSFANGVFECAPRRVWAEVYSYNRPSVTVETVADVIRPAFEKAGLLFVWRDPEGREWGFWTGITKPGRLPAPSRLKKGHDAIGPNPPAKALQKYLNSHKNGRGQTMASHGVADDQVGFGSGFGTGSGECAAHTPAVCPPPETLLTIWQEEHGLLPEVQEFTEDRRKKCRARLRKHKSGADGFLSRFRQAITKANQTPFLRGEGDRGWKADFDWFIANNTNFVRVLEGKYDRGAGNAASNVEAAHSIH